MHPDIPIRQLIGPLVCQTVTLQWISIKFCVFSESKLKSGQFHILHWILLVFRSSEEIKARLQYSKAILIHFMSNVWLWAHFPPNKFVIWWKTAFLTQKNLIPRYSTTFELPNHLHLQKMRKIWLYNGKIQAKQISLL